jgi:hypothetical protein
LDGSDVSKLPFVLLTPKLFVLACVHEFGAYGEIITTLNDSPSDQCLYAKLFRDLRWVDVTLLVPED